MAMASHASEVVNVLLVDDDEDDATITRALLAEVPSTKFKLDWAPSYERGLAMMKEEHHDIDLVDYQLGARSGIDLLREVHEHHLHAPVIMLTGQGNESVVLEAIRSGASDYIPKGLMTPDALERAICHAVEKSKLEKSLDEHHRQLQLANAELLKKNEEIQRFYHVLAHELKTPLTAATEFLGILLDGTAGSLTQEQREYVRIVDGCCDSLTRNINDLFDITRLETGKLSVYPRSDSLTVLIPQVVQSLAPVAQEKGITLQYSMDPDLPNVFMDRHRIRQVLTNLLENALKFNHRGGTVKVTVIQEPTSVDRMRISVSDTGPGIPGDQLDRIFERLYQIRSDASPSVVGLGIGLFICQELVKLHGNMLSVESCPGKGSTFFFTLLKS